MSWLILMPSCYILSSSQTVAGIIFPRPDSSLFAAKHLCSFPNLQIWRT